MVKLSGGFERRLAWPIFESPVFAHVWTDRKLQKLPLRIHCTHTHTHTHPPPSASEVSAEHNYRPLPLYRVARLSIRRPKHVRL